MDKLISQCFEKLLTEFNKEETKCKLETDVLDYIVKYIGDKLWPYIMFLIVLVTIIIVLMTYFAYKINSSQVIN
jgi:hypothetical protein